MLVSSLPSQLFAQTNYSVSKFESTCQLASLIYAMEREQFTVDRLRIEAEVWVFAERLTSFLGH